MKTEKSRFLFSKPFYAAGIASLVLIFLSLAADSLFMLSNVLIIRLIYSLLVAVSSAVMLGGFYHLGNVYKSKFVRVLVLVGVLSLFLIFFGGIFLGPHLESSFLKLNQTMMEYNETIFLLNSNNTLSTAQVDNLTSELTLKMAPLVMPLVFLFAIGFVLGVVYLILWGVALIKLDKKVRYAKTAGLLFIIGAVTAIVIAGLFVLFAAFIFEVMILFDQARKFKEY